MTLNLARKPLAQAGTVLNDVAATDDVRHSYSRDGGYVENDDDDDEPGVDFRMPASPSKDESSDDYSAVSSVLNAEIEQRWDQ